MPPILSSAANPRIKQYRKLRESASFRRKTGLCIVEGLRLCRDALQSGGVVEIFATPDFAQRQPDFWEEACAHSQAALIDPALEKELSETQSPQGVYGVVQTEGLTRSLSELTGERVLLLDRIADPGNMGTILRTAEAFGVEDILLTPGCCDVFSPKVLRSSMGGAFRLRIYSMEDPLDDIQGLQRRGMIFYSAVPDARALPIQDLPPVEKGGLIIGNEAEGIRRELIELTTPVTIPMKGRAESLNAAIAAGILIWEVFAKH